MTVYPAWATNDTLRAVYLRQSVPQMFATTTSQALDGTNTNGVLDNELFFYGEANAKYLVETYLLFNWHCTAATSTDIDVTVGWVTTPTTSVLAQNFGPGAVDADMVDRTNTRVSVLASRSSASTHFLHDDSLDTVIWGRAILNSIGSAPGNITLQWSPNTSISGTITRDVNSVMVVTRFT